MAAAAHELAPDVAAGFTFVPVPGGAVVPVPGGAGALAATAAGGASAHAARAAARIGRQSILPLVSSAALGAFRLPRVSPVEPVEPRIEPEPDDAERRAILLALERAAPAVASEPTLDPYRSAWRQAGIRESLDASDGG